MQPLLDTHGFPWWMFDDPKFSRRVRSAIDNDGENEVFATDDISGTVAAEGFAEQTISVRHAQHAGNLGGHHRDPFDRLLIAQAMLEDMSLVSNERAFDAYGVKRLW